MKYILARQGTDDPPVRSLLVRVRQWTVSRRLGTDLTAAQQLYPVRDVTETIHKDDNLLTNEWD